MADFCKKGFWMVLPFKLVEHLPNLRLSPLGVMPQCDRRPRLIVDLSFWGIYAETLPWAPPEVMQFGRMLEQILYCIRHANPVYGPVYVGKYDLSDAFSTSLQQLAGWRIAYVITVIPPLSLAAFSGTLHKISGMGNSSRKFAEQCHDSVK